MLSGKIEKLPLLLHNLFTSGFNNETPQHHV